MNMVSQHINANYDSITQKLLRIDVNTSTHSQIAQEMMPVRILIFTYNEILAHNGTYRSK